MIYLTGITKAKEPRKHPKKFNRLKIPFNSIADLEKFILNRANKFKCKVYPMYLEKQ